MNYENNIRSSEFLQLAATALAACVSKSV
jgi:hypothetical protein